jgi:hypothetical protein
VGISLAWEVSEEVEVVVEEDSNHYILNPNIIIIAR